MLFRRFSVKDFQVFEHFSSETFTFIQRRRISEFIHNLDTSSLAYRFFLTFLPLILKSDLEVSLATRSARPRALCVARETGSWPLILRWVVAYDYCSRNFKGGDHFWMEPVKRLWITRLWRIIRKLLLQIRQRRISYQHNFNRCRPKQM